MTDFGDLRLAWLETFVEVADAKKRTAAAAAIGTTQSNVSKQLEKLWHWFGDSLVVSGSSPLILTPAGKEFLEVAQEVVQRLRDARPARGASPVEQAPRVSGKDVEID